MIPTTKPKLLPTLLLALFTLLTPQSKADGTLCNNRSVISTFQTDFPAINLYLVGSTAYIASGNDGLNIIDVSNINDMRVLGSFDTTDWAYSVCVVDSVAYIASSRAGLTIVDVSNPEQPTLLAELKHAPQVNYTHVDVRGSVAYIADLSDGLIIIDISDQSTPTLLGSFGNSG